MLLKTLGIGIEIIAASSYGFYLSFIFEQKIRMLKDFYKMFLLLKGEINYAPKEIEEVFENICVRTNKEPREFISLIKEEFVNNKTSLVIAWEKISQEYLIKKLGFKDDEIQSIKDIGSNLGITDKNTQIDYLEKNMEFLNIEIRELEKVKREKCKLYRTLGVMAGMFIGIVLI